MINILLNILWLIFGGFCTALGWFLAAFVMVLTIVGIPFARAAVNMGLFALWPFGRRVVDRSDLTGEWDLGTSPLGTLGNIIWVIFAGWWLFLIHLIMAFGLAITLIGIPFAWQHLKFAGLAFWPIGRAIVDRDEGAPSPLGGFEVKPRSE